MSAFARKKVISLLLIFSLAASVCFVGTGDVHAESGGIPEAPSYYTAEAVSGPVSNITVNLGKDPGSYNFTWSSRVQGANHIQWAEIGDTEDPGEYKGLFANSAASCEEDYYFGYVCRAKISGLKSSTRYAYRVGGEGCGWSDLFTFKTGAFDDGSFSFIYVGDAQIGAGGSDTADSEHWNVTLEKARVAFGDRIEFLLSAGDQTDDHARPEQFNGYCSPSWLRSLPQMNNVGNHDNGPTYSSYFTFDGVDGTIDTGAGAYGGDYWVAYDGALIVSLNSNEMSISTHKDYLTRAIDEYAALYGQPNWKIVTFHHSAFSAAASRLETGEYYRKLCPAFSELGVDVVLMGHDHVYTRAYMQRGAASIDDPDEYVEVAGDPYGSFVDPDAEEVFYLTVNSSTGSKFYAAYNEELPYIAHKDQADMPNYTKIDVTPNSMTFRTFYSMADCDTSDTVDFFAIRRTLKGDDGIAPHLDVPSESVYRANGIFDPMEGVFAYDNADGDLTGRVTVTGTADPCRESVLTYTVTDSAGNVSTATRTVKPYVEKTPVSTENTVWKYLDDGVLPFDDEDDFIEWTLDSFDDGEWKEGKAPLGSYMDALGVHTGRSDVTLLPLYYPDWSDDAGLVLPSYFFRATFDLDDPASVDRITARLFYDDGYDLYINGVCVRSQNTQFAYEKLGYCYCNSGGPAEGDAFVIDNADFIASLELKKKGNVLAVQLFQSSGSSDDIFFQFDSLTFGKKMDGLPFSDVETGKWYYINIGKAYCRGLFSGVSKNSFAPGATFTRAMAWTVLAKIAGAELTGGEKWYSGPQAWAVSEGISDGTYPNGKITREQLALMLYNLAGKPTVSGTIDGFSDAATAAGWARTALAWAVETGLISGRGSGVLAPKADATRAEACTILIKFAEMRERTVN